MKHGVHPWPSLVACASAGYFFCRDCQRVTDQLERDYLPAVCGLCGSVRIQWQAPVFSAGEFVLSRRGRQGAD